MARDSPWPPWPAPPSSSACRPIATASPPATWPAWPAAPTAPWPTPLRPSGCWPPEKTFATRPPKGPGQLCAPGSCTATSTASARCPPATAPSTPPSLRSPTSFTRPPPCFARTSCCRSCEAQHRHCVHRQSQRDGMLKAETRPQRPTRKPPTIGPARLDQASRASSEEVLGDLAGGLLGVVAQLGRQILVEPEGGQPMDQGPGGDTGPQVAVGAVGGLGRRRVQQPPGLLLGLDQLGVVGAVQLGAEHHLKMSPMVDGETHV